MRSKKKNNIFHTLRIENKKRKILLLSIRLTHSKPATIFYDRRSDLVSSIIVFFFARWGASERRSFPISENTHYN